MRMSLGTVADRDLELARLAAVDAWYDQMLQAAKRVDPSASMSKHDTLATLSVGGRSFLLTGDGWSGAQQTGESPDQLIASYLVSSDVSQPAYVPAPDIAAVALISDLGQSKWGVPIPNSPADQPRIDEYYRQMSALQDSGFVSTYYPVEYPAQFAPKNAANTTGLPGYAGNYIPNEVRFADTSSPTSDQLTGPTGVLTPAPQTTSTVLNSILNQTASTLGLDATQSSWLEQNKWLVLGGAAAIAWFLLKRK